MVKPALRTKSISTKLTEQESVRLETLAAASGQNMSEWVRDALLEQAERKAATSPDETLLAELVGLRSILLNLFFALASGERMTAEQMQAVIARSDTGKLERARKLLAPADAVRAKEESEVRP
jgi:predicted RNA-binding Zn ribbon-like protein